MRAAYDEIVSAGMNRQQGFERVIGALLKAEIAEKRARGSAKLPLVKAMAGHHPRGHADQRAAGARSGQLSSTASAT